MSEIKDIIQHTIDQNPSDLSDTVNSVLNSKVSEFINNKRQEIASSYFGGNNGEQNVEDTD